MEDTKKYYKWLKKRSWFCKESEITDMLLFIWDIENSLDISAFEVEFYMDFFKAFPEMKEAIRTKLNGKSIRWNNFFTKQNELKKCLTIENRDIKYAKITLILEGE